LITIFASPKPFADRAINIAQRNSIQSWKALRPACDIILFGNEDGTKEIAAEYGLKHIPNVDSNSEGLPKVKYLFDKAESLSRFNILTYVNSDIILMNDFVAAISTIYEKRKSNPFLMVGQRYNLEVPKLVDFNDNSWENHLRLRIHEEGQLRGCGAIDYFVFTKGLWPDMPEFVVGRVGFDNWLIYRARSLSVDVIDATEMVSVVHQKHIYRKDNIYKRRQCPEAIKQLQLVGGEEYFFRISDANLLLTPAGLIKRPFKMKILKRMIQVGPAMYPKLKICFRLMHLLISALKRLRLNYILGKVQ